MLFPKTPHLAQFLREQVGATSVEVVTFVVLSLFLCVTILSGIRAGFDESPWPILVCILNSISMVALSVDLYFFAFSNFGSLLALIIADSIATTGNIVMCFVGTETLRNLSASILVLSLTAKGIGAAYLISSLVQIIVTFASLIKTEEPRQGPSP